MDKIDQSASISFLPLVLALIAFYNLLLFYFIGPYQDSQLN